MKKRIFGVVVAVALLTLAVGWFAFGGNYIGKEATQTTVGLKWLHQAQFAGMYFAQEEGVYKKHGLDVMFQEFDFETDQIDDLVSGKTDFALISSEELLLAADRGESIQAVAAIYQFSPYAITMLKESGIDKPIDFEGKTLGNKGGKLEEELFYLLLLESAGLTPEDATIKKLGFEQREIDDLRSGAADTVGLYRTDQLYFYKKEGLDYSIIYPEQYGLNVYNDVLVTRTDLIEQDPDMVRSFVRATVAGWEKVIEYPEKAIEYSLLYVTNDAYNDLTYQHFILEESIPLIRPNDAYTIGNMTHAHWERQYTSMRQKNMVKTDVDVSEIFTTEFLPR